MIFFSKINLSKIPLLTVGLLFLISCSFPRNAKKQNSSNLLSIVENDSIKIKQIIISSFGNNKIDTIQTGFQNLEVNRDRINLKIQVQELYSTGWYPVNHCINNVSFDNQKFTHQLEKSFSPSLKYYKVSECLSPDFIGYHIQLLNNSGKFIFIMKIKNKDEDFTWNTCIGYLDNTYNILAPQSKMELNNVGIFNLKNLEFVFGTFDSVTNELSTIRANNYTVDGHSIIVNIDN